MNPPDAAEIEASFRQALAAHEQGQLAQAQAGYEAILRRHPRHFDALHMLGIASAQLGDPHKGAELLRQAVAVDPGRAAAHSNLGNICKGLKRLDEAVASYDRALALRPELPEIWYNRGNALADLDRPEEALASYERAIALKPEFPEALANRGNALLALDRAGEALASYDRAIALRPAHAAAHSSRGNALSELERLDEAMASYGQAIALNPDFVPAHVNLGSVLAQRGRFAEALASFTRAFQLVPGLDETLGHCADLLRDVGIGTAPPELREIVIRCFESRRVDSTDVLFASTVILREDLEASMKPGAAAQISAAALDGLTHGLLNAHLTHALIADPGLEAFLTGIRARLLLEPAEEDMTGFGERATLQILIALACQGFLNEFIWHVTPAETEALARIEATVVATIRKGEAPSVGDLLRLAAYRPLHEVPEISAWCATSLEGLDGQARAVFRRVVLDPLRDVELAARVDKLTSIDDPVSTAVRAQYEENPYPRWDSLTAGRRVGYTAMIRHEIAPHRPQLPPPVRAPRVLIAGCGSGKHPIAHAMRVRGAEVLGIDLSRASLAYAQRMAHEMGVANVRFAQGDILNLRATAERFDVIECVGVLHHMADPAAGLDALLDLLEPDGYIRLGLYSERARQPVARLRALGAGLAIAPLRNDIRALREALIGTGSADLAAIRQTPDFYATSAVRDLLFHVQEWRFSLPQVRALLETRRLEFLGFQLQDPRVKLAYAQRFPGDPACTDLGNWDVFEADNPQLFRGMYQFWCRRQS